MLYKLEVENFYSIRDAQVLDLTIAPNVPDPDNRYTPIFFGSQLRTPKVIALYGANASGKTNVLRALEFIIKFITSSAERTSPGFPCERFNDDESRSRPIRLAIEAGGVMNLSQQTIELMRAGENVEHGIYRYELSIDVKDGAAYRISHETLRQKPNGQGKWQRIFERDVDGKVKDSRSFPMTGYHHLLNTLRPNVSLLSSFAMFQHPIAMAFVGEVGKSIFQIGALESKMDQSIIEYLIERPSIVSKLNKELNRIDLGIEEMRFTETTNGTRPMFKHSGLEVDMPWLLESHGTRSFIKMFPAITITLENGGLCVLDEFDISIHPIVLPEILRWFHDEYERNKFNAQLWFSCHSASLLDDLNKEEIVICEKNRLGVTHIYSLMDVKLRRDENLYRKYLSGAYGGVPQIG